MPVQQRSFVFPFAVLQMKLLAVNSNNNPGRPSHTYLIRSSQIRRRTSDPLTASFTDEVAWKFKIMILPDTLRHSAQEYKGRGIRVMKGYRNRHTVKTGS
jgi:hypothetical protein